MAVIVQVCGPVVEGLSVACGGLASPFESGQEAILGPLTPSLQPKVVCTTCPTAYVAPGDGELIDVDGAPPRCR